MATWRDVLIGLAIAALFILLVHGVTKDERFLCQNLYIPTRLIHDDPNTVNRMLEICGFHNIQVKGREQFKKEMQDYLNATAAREA